MFQFQGYTFFVLITFLSEIIVEREPLLRFALSDWRFTSLLSVGIESDLLGRTLFEEFRLLWGSFDIR